MWTVLHGFRQASTVTSASGIQARNAITRRATIGADKHGFGPWGKGGGGRREARPKKYVQYLIPLYGRESNERWGIHGNMKWPLHFT